MSLRYTVTMHIRLRLIAPCVLLMTLAFFATVQAAAPKHATVTATTSDGLIHLHLSIDDGFHAQSHTPLDSHLIPLTITMNDAAGASFGEPRYPPATVEDYPLLGKVSVYTGAVTIDVPMQRSDASAEPATLSGFVRLQICNSNTCFAPQKLSFEISPMGSNATTSAATPATSSATTVPSTQAAAASVVPLQSESQSVSSHGIGWALGSALLAGLIFNVMPCVLPVLPLKAIGFYEVSQHRRGRTLLLGLFFSIGMIGIFALLALLLLAGKALLGRQFSWGQQFSYPWFVWSMAILLAVLGFGLLGAFSVRLPTSVYGLSFRHDTLTGNFLWGGLTAILSTPCTAPLFPPLLGWALGQSLAVGMLSVITVGVGMSLPYLILSAVPELARKFPRVGPGAELIKQMMGFLLLSTAAFLVGVRLLGEPNQWWLVLSIIGIACGFLIIKTSQIAKIADGNCCDIGHRGGAVRNVHRRSGEIDPPRTVDRLQRRNAGLGTGQRSNRRDRFHGRLVSQLQIHRADRVSRCANASGGEGSQRAAGPSGSHG